MLMCSERGQMLNCTDGADCAWYDLKIHVQLCT